MKFTKEIEQAIKNFIIESTPHHENNLVSITIKHFEISKPTATKYINQLIHDNIIMKQKNGRYPKYSLVEDKKAFSYLLENKLEEDVIWRKDISQLLSNASENVKRSFQYCFTEMVNNVIDHSNAKTMEIDVTQDALAITIWVRDDGIGIFNKIQKDLGLEDPKHSILELAKGKFTSDPEKHTGEGIFFTSRICDDFSIVSDKLVFLGHREDDWLFEYTSASKGTAVYMKMKKNSKVSVADIFNEYSDPDRQPSFHKTCIPVKLMEYEGEALLSRSQAKRLIIRFDRFLEVILDFSGVNEIGQAFADEIFRVFRKAHPDVHIVPINCCLAVQKMIARTSTDYFQSIDSK